MMKKVPQNRLIKMLNPARKKKERFEAICQHLKDNDFDVVFLQEVWFEKDYEFLKECLNGTGYTFSNCDSECGTNSVMLSLFFKSISFFHNVDFQMSLVGCSGLVTMSRYQLSNEMTSPLPKGELYTTLSKPEDLMSYIQFGIQRKVLIHDLFVDDVCTIRLVNTHFSPSDTFSALRERQAREVIRNLDTTTKYNMTVLGMDLNDEPFQNSHWTASYRVFKNANFSDGFNEEFDTNMAYPVTFADETNSWTTKNSKTLDYIMVLPHEIDVENNGHVIVQEAGFVDIAVQDLKTTNGHSFSEHNSVNATIWLQYY